MLHDRGEALDPLADAEDARGQEPRQGRLRPTVVAALHLRPRRDHGPARLLGHARWARRLGTDLEAARRRSPAIIEPRLLNVVRLHLGPQVDALRPFPWQPKTGRHVAKEGTDLGIPRGCSRSGSAAPAATSSARCHGSATPTPTRSDPTSRSSPTRAARPRRAARVARRPGSARAPPSPHSTC